MRDRAQQSWPALSKTAHGAVAAAALQVGVGEHDVGALAAQLEGDPLHLGGAAGHDPLADLGRAGEADLADRRVGDEPLPDHRALARHDVEHVRRAARPRSASSASRIAVSGVSSAGLSTTVLPAARAGANPQPAIGIGKFHGTITPTTPSGSWKVTSIPPGTGICRPVSRSGRAGVVVQDVADVAGLPPGVADGVAGVADLQLRPAPPGARRPRRRTAAAAGPVRRAPPAARPRTRWRPATIAGVDLVHGRPASRPR